MGFARSRLGRRFARWEEVIEALRSDPRTAPALRERRCEPIDLEALARLARGNAGPRLRRSLPGPRLNPNLGHIPPESEVDWLLHHLIQRHDVWHVVTGWGNDEIGESGLGAFYLAQLAAPAFFGFLLSLLGLSTVLRHSPSESSWTRSSPATRWASAPSRCSGWTGRRSGGTQLAELRTRFGIAGSGCSARGSARPPEQLV